MMEFTGIAEERQTKENIVSAVIVTGTFGKVTFFDAHGQTADEGKATDIEEFSLNTRRRRLLANEEREIFYR